MDRRMDVPTHGHFRPPVMLLGRLVHTGLSLLSIAFYNVKQPT